MNIQIKRILFVLLLVLLFIGFTHTIVAHASGIYQETPPPDPTFTLKDAFTFLGAPATIAIFLSFLAERLPQWRNLDSSVQMIVSTAVALALGYGSYALRTYTPAWLVADVQPYVTITVTLTPFIISQIWHKKDKASPQLE